MPAYGDRAKLTPPSGPAASPGMEAAPPPAPPPAVTLRQRAAGLLAAFQIAMTYFPKSNHFLSGRHRGPAAVKPLLPAPAAASARSPLRAAGTQLAVTPPCLRTRPRLPASLSRSAKPWARPARPGALRAPARSGPASRPRWHWLPLRLGRAHLRAARPTPWPVRRRAPVSPSEWRWPRPYPDRAFKHSSPSPSVLLLDGRVANRRKLSRLKRRTCVT